MHKNKSVKCEKLECFANIHYRKDFGICKLLNDGFTYECPFFKTVKEYNEGIKKYGGLH